MEPDQPASPEKKKAVRHAWDGTLASVGANALHVLVTGGAIAVLTGIIVWYRKGDAAEGKAQMLTLTSGLMAFCIIGIALFTFHLGRGFLKVRIHENEEQIKSLKAKLQTLEPRETEIAALKAQLATWQEKHPKLTISFRDNDEEFFRGGWYFIILSSDAVGSTVHEARASIVDLRKIGSNDPVVPIGTTDARPFPWILGTTEKDLIPLPESPVQTMQNPHFALNPGERRPILIATYVPEKQVIRLGGFGWTGGLHLENGAYRIRVRATGLNARAGEICLAIGVNSAGKLICEIDKSHPSHRQDRDAEIAAAN